MGKAFNGSINTVNNAGIKGIRAVLDRSIAILSAPARAVQVLLVSAAQGVQILDTVETQSFVPNKQPSILY